MDIQRIRATIPATRNMVYLNTGWSGPSPSPVTRRMQEQLTFESEEGPAGPAALERSRAVTAELTDAVATLLNAPADTIALTQNTTQGQVTVLNGLEWHPGDEVVTCSLEHPSVLTPCLHLQRSHGVTVRIAQIDPQDDRETLLSKLEACIGPKTRLIFLSHIEFTCGLRFPAREVAELAHRRGAYLLLDGAQGAGQVALDMEAMECDFYAMPGHKWLLGPDGTGALYLRKELIPQVTPRYPVSGATARWDRDGSLEPEEALPRKFRLSTTSTALEAGMAEAIAFYQEAGPQQAEERSQELGRRLQQALAQIAGVSLTGPGDPALSSALVTFAVQGKEPRQVVEALWQEWRIAGRQVGFPMGVRLCTAYFNTEEELEKVAEAVAEITHRP